MIQYYEQNVVSMENKEKETNEMDANDLALRVVKLQHYVRLNFMGFRKITKKYDKHNETAASCWYLGGILREPFMSLDFDLLVQMVAHCFKAIAIYKSVRGGKNYSDKSYFCGCYDKIQILPKSFLETMTNSNYLVDEDNMMHVRIELAKNFPLISIGDSNRLPYDACKQENTKETTIASSPSSLPDISSPQPSLSSKPDLTHGNVETTTPSSQLPLTKNEIPSQCALSPMKSFYCFKKYGICCVYFDSPSNFKMYTKAIQDPFETTPYILRFRWNTSLEKNPMKFPDGIDYSTSPTSNLKNYLPETLIIEFVTSPLVVASSCESWDSFECMDSNSQLLVTSEIAEMILKDNNINIDSIIKSLKGIEDEKARILLTKILHTIHVDQCQPMIQHWFHRTQFRYISEKQDKQIFVTLDENIRYLPLESFDATKEPCSTFSFWWNSSLCSSPTALEKIGINSPFGVLSVSYVGMQRPLVVSRIVGLSNVLELWNYSSFIHGMATCFHDQLLPSQKPEWLHLVRHLPITIDTSTTPPTTHSVEHNTTYKDKKKKGGYDDAGIRVDIMSTKPRDRVIHEHASDLQIQVSLYVTFH
jgi:SPX domain protein involved in polyphosphate accumulation